MGMKARRDTIALAAEMLAKMFDRGEEDLVQQVNTVTAVVRVGYVAGL